nr:hypothetical protein [uncultured bacterium]
MLKFIFDLVCLIRLHLFPLGTFGAGTATPNAPVVWPGKLTNVDTWTFTLFHSPQSNQMKSEVN